MFLRFFNYLFADRVFLLQLFLFGYLLFGFGQVISPQSFMSSRLFSQSYFFSFLLELKFFGLFAYFSVNLIEFILNLKQMIDFPVIRVDSLFLCSHKSDMPFHITVFYFKHADRIDRFWNIFVHLIFQKTCLILFQCFRINLKFLNLMNFLNLLGNLIENIFDLWSISFKNLSWSPFDMLILIFFIFIQDFLHLSTF